MRDARADGNQTEIVKALREIGCSVQLLHTVGKGCPDAVCGFQGYNVMLEFKDGSKPPSARKLTPDQEKWHSGWQGQVNVVCSPEEAVGLIWKIAGKSQP